MIKTLLAFDKIFLEKRKPLIKNYKYKLPTNISTTWERGPVQRDLIAGNQRGLSQGSGTPAERPERLIEVSQAEKVGRYFWAEGAACSEALWKNKSWPVGETER